MSICSGGLAAATVLFSFASGKNSGENLFVECVRKKFRPACTWHAFKSKIAPQLSGNSFCALDESI
jgi:hypothetical protein